MQPSGCADEPVSRHPSELVRTSVGLDFDCYCRWLRWKSGGGGGPKGVSDSRRTFPSPLGGGVARSSIARRMAQNAPRLAVIHVTQRRSEGVAGTRATQISAARAKKIGRRPM